MATIVACKLPHGLTVRHAGQVININGANVNHNDLAPAPNGQLADGPDLSAGYGLTTLNGAAEEAFNDWCARAQFKLDASGNPTKEPLDEPFVPLVNGTLKAYKSEADARKDTSSISTGVSTGMDGLDGDAEMKAAAESANLVPEKGVSERSGI